MLGSFSAVGIRNKISPTNREMLAEDPIIGPFVEKENYGMSLKNSYIKDFDIFNNWELRIKQPNIVIINFDALRADFFGKLVDGKPVTPTFDSLLNTCNIYLSEFHTSSSST